ncbi:MAG TPA: sn-glycerol-3-phosphate ABC transporter ATP-binding protein UgpC [Ktedonobacterales bacterium]|nr:sn-glycerol-3-phosphate ABC transporter ATP-binding protein UgpC [Ktedonobacterales bacterium]
MADVRFEHVYKQYGDNTPVITDLNLKVNDHEFLVLVGPSGCGKSTALRMIAGLEDISNGNLFIGERIVNDVAPKDRDIAMVFQNYALYPHMSVYDNMAFGLQQRHTPKAEIEERVQRAADLLGIKEYLQRKPRALSGGQRQRVALGRALVRNPQVFLLDEPLSNLDAKLRVQTRTVIARLHQTTKTTFVYVTHDQVEAMTMGDRIAVLNAGVIQQLGTPQELYDHPANLFVAGFIGSPSMDFFNATLTNGTTATIGEGAAARTLTLQGESVQAAKQTHKVILGIRPEDFHLASDGAENTLNGAVDVVEHLGNEQLIYLNMPGAMIPETSETKAVTARLAPDVIVRPGQRLSLAVDTARVHVFDAETTKRLA